MIASNSRSKRIAFFGATGGCANAALVLALRAGYECTALARTPPKLEAMLLARGVSPEEITAHLSIIHGDARDPAAVRATIAPSHDATRADDQYAFDSTHAANVVVSGIGMMGYFSKSMDRTVCGAFSRVLTEVIQTTRPPLAVRPFVVAISSTGVDRNAPRDVPLHLVPLYRVIAKTPHADKRIMESTLIEAEHDGSLGGLCLLRPSIMLEGKEHSRSKVRIGTEKNPAIGCTIRKEDVGRWIYEELVRGDESAWRGARVSITL